MNEFYRAWSIRGGLRFGSASRTRQDHRFRVGKTAFRSIACSFGVAVVPLELIEACQPGSKF